MCVRVYMAGVNWHTGVKLCLYRTHSKEITCVCVCIWQESTGTRESSCVSIEHILKRSHVRVYMAGVNWHTGVKFAPGTYRVKNGVKIVWNGREWIDEASGKPSDPLS